jgi:hypothetical protein
LQPLVAQTGEAIQAALAHLEQLTQAAHDLEATLQAQWQEAARTASLAQFDPALLDAFFRHPYVIRPLGGGRYELLVPRFVGLRVGWPVRTTDAYDVFEVDRFLHLIAPLPAWLADELGFVDPQFRAIIEGTLLTITEGDPAVAYERIGGRRMVARREGARLWLRPASRFEVIRRIIRNEGFLPYAPHPVPSELLRPSQVARVPDTDAPAFTLRPHQAAAFQALLERGAVAIFARPGGGKSYPALQALAELRGRKLILCPRRTLVAQWQARTRLFLEPAAADEVTVATYQGAHKLLDGDWTLVIFDEAHHVPADFALDAATTLRAPIRLGLSATPWREDGNEDLIPALCGFPIGGDWPVEAQQQPTVTIWLTRDKLKVVRELVRRPVGGKTLIYTQRLEIGDQVAAVLGVPFVQHKTRNPGAVIAAHDIVVTSSIADEGLSIPDVRRVIEVDFLFGSRQQAGQRAGRLAHQVDTEAPGEHHVLMTPDEFTRYHKRLLAYERWGLQLTVQVADAGIRPAQSGETPRPPVSGPTPARRAATNRAAGTDPLTALRAVPAVAARLAQAERQARAADRADRYLALVFTACQTRPLHPDEIAEGKGVQGKSTRARIRAAARALQAAGLLIEADAGRLQVNAAEITRLTDLARAVAPGNPVPLPEVSL